ncbi:hypothetical protein OG204_16335 [Streptomyces sp. NBC_01387]|uniref:hypothetical protein n=1 Tax=unclassified Streptomyces TaxID=2593676 RepID=UPI0020258AA9|nr:MULTISPECIES: hypothetical protein [unclassified Streptomyces]MCX4550061.1 hypothetical protein [Streptomyces sp. NBC_01500]WSC21557.1 hypothetical protein OIE60_18790 [Streptomyces sp. NBC_01766]WSV55521.1 hypothetical protein OG282_18495 [Streptomyces sp. NBC_01014]
MPTVSSTNSPEPTGGYRNNPLSLTAPDSTVGGGYSHDNSVDWSGVLVVDLGELKNARAVFDDARAVAHDCAAALDRTVTAPALGDRPWGTDPLGKTFEANYAGDDGSGPAVVVQGAIDTLEAIFRKLVDDIGAVHGVLEGAEGHASALADTAFGGEQGEAE